MPELPERVTLVEVGPRDGLQNEPALIATDAKVAFIEKLATTGVKQIEVTSFVHPQAVPQLADALEVVRRLPQCGDVVFSALVPNRKGLERALEAGVKRIVVFTAASEAFAQKNIRMSIDESLDVFRPVVADALSAGASVRAYLSTCFVCPYAGEVPTAKVLELTERLIELGVDEVSISDTIGAAAPSDIHEVFGCLLDRVPADKLAVHVHDTYGTALANVYAALELGIATVDASAGGLGGCPFAPGATGNVATEDVVYMLDRMGIETGVKLEALAEASRYMAGVLGRELPSRQLRRLNARC